MTDTIAPPEGDLEDLHQKVAAELARLDIQDVVFGVGPLSDPSMTRWVEITMRMRVPRASWDGTRENDWVTSRSGMLWSDVGREHMLRLAVDEGLKMLRWQRSSRLSRGRSRSVGD